MFFLCQWAYSLVKDGKLLYDAEKLKRESFGKLFSEYLKKHFCILHLLVFTSLFLSMIVGSSCLFPPRKILPQKPSV